MNSPVTKTREEVEALKRDWKNCPEWDLEDTKGFEAYRDELKAFSKECDAEWEKADKERQEREDKELEEELESIGLLGMLRMINYLESKLDKAEERIYKLENPNE